MVVVELPLKMRNLDRYCFSLHLVICVNNLQLTTGLVHGRTTNVTRHEHKQEMTFTQIKAFLVAV